MDQSKNEVLFEHVVNGEKKQVLVKFTSTKHTSHENNMTTCISCQKPFLIGSSIRSTIDIVEIRVKENGDIISPDSGIFEMIERSFIWKYGNAVDSSADYCMSCKHKVDDDLTTYKPQYQSNY